MSISSIAGSALTPEVQAQYAAKLMKMAQQNPEIASSIIEDVAEISQEALELCMSELMQL